MIVALGVVVVGGCLVTAGAALLSPAAGLIVGGLMLATVGWLAIDVGEHR